mgnify:FL=1
MSSGTSASNFKYSDANDLFKSFFSSYGFDNTSDSSFFDAYLRAFARGGTSSTGSTGGTYYTYSTKPSTSSYSYYTSPTGASYSSSYSSNPSDSSSSYYNIYSKYANAVTSSGTGKTYYYANGSTTANPESATSSNASTAKTTSSPSKDE